MQLQKGVFAVIILNDSILYAVIILFKIIKNFNY